MLLLPGELLTCGEDIMGSGDARGLKRSGQATVRAQFVSDLFIEIAQISRFALRGWVDRHWISNPEEPQVHDDDGMREGQV